jgi:hypothetical protein
MEFSTVLLLICIPALVVAMFFVRRGRRRPRDVRCGLSAMCPPVADSPQGHVVLGSRTSRVNM